MGGKTHTDVRHEVWSPGRAFLDDVQHVAPVHHGEVCALPHPVDEFREQRVPEPAQRLLAREATGQFEGGDAKSVSPSLGQVNNEPALLQHTEQVVDGGPGQVERGGQGRGGGRTALGREETENPQRGIRCGDLRAGHAPPVLASEIPD